MLRIAGSSFATQPTLEHGIFLFDHHEFSFRDGSEQIWAAKCGNPPIATFNSQDGFAAVEKRSNKTYHGITAARPDVAILVPVRKTFSKSRIQAGWSLVLSRGAIDPSLRCANACALFQLAFGSEQMKRMCVLVVVILGTLPAVAGAETIYGVTNLQQLVTFDSVTRSVTATVSPAGFSITGELLISIDVRPATGELYGLSSFNNLYKINPVTGARTQVGATMATPPMGAYKAIDFNPTVDRIRLLGSGGTPNNLRYHPDTGALVLQDGDLAFAAGDMNVGDTPAVVNGAYTNSFAGAATTTLYDLDAFNDVLATQSPPNNGTLNTVGALGFDLTTGGGFTGFDISGASGIAYLVGNNLAAGGLTANSLYQVNLATGAASALGAVTGVSGSFRDIAVVGAVPEPTAIMLVVSGLAVVAVGRRRRV